MNNDIQIKKTENVKGINIGDCLFFVTMVFVIGFPTPSIFKAISIVTFFVYTFCIQIIREKSTGNFLQYFWAISFFVYCHLSERWSVFPKAMDEVITNVQWSMLLSVAIVNYIIINKLSVIEIAKRMAVVACVFLLDVIIYGTFFESRLTLIIGGRLVNANTFGQIAIGIGCFLFFWAKKDKWKNVFLIGGVVILLAISLLSGSRKTLFTFAIYVIFILFYEYPSKSPEKTLGKFLGIILVIGVSYLCIMNIDVLYDTIGSRIDSLFDFMEGNETSDGSAKSRVLMIEKGLDMFMEKPLLGHGLNTFSYKTVFNTYAHNNFVEILANLGIIGFLLYYVPLLIYFYRAYSNWKRKEDGSIVPLVIIFVFLLNDFANVSYFSIVSHCFLALAIGLCINNYKKAMPITKNSKGEQKIL